MVKSLSQPLLLEDPDRKGLQGPSDSGPKERKIESFGDKELEPKSSDEAELRPDDPVFGVDGTPWSWEGTVDSLESEATEFSVFKVDTSAASYKESFKEAETQTCAPLDSEERRLSVQGCAACGSGLRENRSDFFPIADSSMDVPRGDRTTTFRGVTWAEKIMAQEVLLEQETSRSKP